MGLFPYGTIVAGSFCNFKLIIVIICLIYRVGALIYVTRFAACILVYAKVELLYLHGHMYLNR